MRVRSQAKTSNIEHRAQYLACWLEKLWGGGNISYNILCQLRLVVGASHSLGQSSAVSEGESEVRPPVTAWHNQSACLVTTSHREQHTILMTSPPLWWGSLTCILQLICLSLNVKSLTTSSPPPERQNKKSYSSLLIIHTDDKHSFFSGFVSTWLAIVRWVNMSPRLTGKGTLSSRYWSSVIVRTGELHKSMTALSTLFTLLFTLLYL